MLHGIRKVTVTQPQSSSVLNQHRSSNNPHVLAQLLYFSAKPLLNAVLKELQHLKSGHNLSNLSIFIQHKVCFCRPNPPRNAKSPCHPQRTPQGTQLEVLLSPCCSFRQAPLTTPGRTVPIAQATHGSTEHGYGLIMTI